jgi:hypothetical protein
MLNVVLTPADLVGLVFFVQHAAEAWAADAALDLLWHRVRGALARLLHLNKSGRGGSVHFRSEIRYDGESVTSIVDAKLSGQENPVAVAAIIEATHREMFDVIRTDQIRKSILKTEIAADGAISALEILPEA